MKHGPDNNSNDAASPHTIRLRGPCKLLWLRNGTQQAEVRVHIPCKIAPDLFELSTISADDTFVLRRNFGMPTGLDGSQSVKLELTNFEEAVRVVLNRGSDAEIERDILESENSISISIGPSLLQNNRWEVEFRWLPAVAGEAQLVIEEP